MSAFDALAGPGADVDTSAPLARANPVAKLVAASVIAFALLLTVDPVTGAVLLGLEALVVPLTGVPWRSVLRRGWLVLLAAIPAGVVTALLGEGSGAVWFDVGPLALSDGSAASGVAITLRILAVGLPGVVLLATTDPTDLADALAQVLHLPARFVLSALAALRLLGVLGEEWRTLGAARRARGLGDDGPLGRLRTVLGQVFALLVLAVRRATVLATAMEARGFGARPERTWARESRLTASDFLVVLGGVGMAALATAVAVLLGTWQLVLT